MNGAAYKDRGFGGAAEMERKRIKVALEKHTERPSPSTSRGVSREKELLASGKITTTIGKAPKVSDGDIVPSKRTYMKGDVRIYQGVGHNDDKFLVLAAMDMPYALDQAVRRRFDKRIYIPLPDAKARQHMFKVHLGDTPHSLLESDFEVLGCRTEGFSGSDVVVCVNDVLFEPVRKTQDVMFFFKTDGGIVARFVEGEKKVYCIKNVNAAFPIPWHKDD